MDRTGTFVSMSRDRLGPDLEATTHKVRGVQADGNRSRAFCTCGWSKRRATPWIARQALEAHIAQAKAS